MAQRVDTSGFVAWTWVLLTIAALTVWRLALAWILPVTQDEAYYFDWARSLAWGYFDHPPGVALLGLGTRLIPGSALAARLGTVVAGALTLLVLARLYRNAGLLGRDDLVLALVLAGTTMPGLAGGFVATPDTPLALCWALALHESERALAGDRRRWLSAGVATGLGLLSKYTMAAIGPVFLWAIWSVDRRALRSPWPYLGGLAALLVFGPNLVWNAHHDWLTLRFQFGHGFAADIGALIAAGDAAHSTIESHGPSTLGQRIASLGGYLAIQLGFWGAVAIPMLVSPWLRGRDKDRAPGLTLPGRSLLLAATLFPLGFFALVALGSDVEANWPAPYLLAAPAWVALGLRGLRPWAWAGAAANLLLVTLYAIHGATAALPLPDSQNRILRETHGFRELAAIAAGLGEPVYADRYQYAAMLRFYAPGLDSTQWPGLSRPSEYLLGEIAPKVGPETRTGPFWLLAHRPMPPEIPGFALGETRTYYDCVGRPLARTAEPPCAQPLHLFKLFHYTPIH